MCGLVGILNYGDFEDKKDEKIRQESMIYFVTELLQLTETRGPNATGITTLFNDCNYMGLKMGIPATEFISRYGGTEKDYDGYLNIWRKHKAPAKMTLGHCRKPTTPFKAETNDNNNNHPIKVGDMVAVHNGTISNHDVIIKMLGGKRDGTVDSEAIVRLLNHYVVETEPFTKEAIQAVCKRLHGQYAVMAYNGNNPYQMVAFRDGRPLELAIVRSLKMVIIASEKDIIKNVLLRYSRMVNLYQSSSSKFMALKKGDIDIESLPDDCLYLFDTRMDIKADTKVTDLYITEKVPRTSKLWDSFAKVATTITDVTPVTEDLNNVHSIVKRHEATKVIEGARVGLAWNKARKNYDEVVKTEEDDKTGADIGNVIIDAEDGEVKKTTSLPSSEHTVMTKTDVDEVSLIETDKPLDDLIADLAKISQVIVTDEVTSKNTLLLEHLQKDAGTREFAEVTVCKRRNDEVSDNNKVTIDTHPDIIEKALIATKAEKVFTSNEELADALEICDKTVLETMPIHSLGNRIKNYFFVKGYKQGYIEHNNNTAGIDSNSAIRTFLIRTKNKLQMAQQNIRVLKVIIKLLNMVFDSAPAHLQLRYKADIKAEVVKLQKTDKEFNQETLNKIFKKTDIDDNNVIKHVMNSVSNG